MHPLVDASLRIAFDKFQGQYVHRNGQQAMHALVWDASKNYYAHGRSPSKGSDQAQVFRADVGPGGRIERAAEVLLGLESADGRPLPLRVRLRWPAPDGRGNTRPDMVIEGHPVNLAQTGVVAFAVDPAAVVAVYAFLQIPAYTQLATRGMWASPVLPIQHRPVRPRF
jgi:hypothetical protein